MCFGCDSHYQGKGTHSWTIGDENENEYAYRVEWHSIGYRIPLQVLGTFCYDSCFSPLLQPFLSFVSIKLAT